MSIQSLGEILKKQMKQTSAGKQISASLVVDRTNEILRDLFGAEARRFSRAMYFKDRAVAIACLSSVMAQEIKLNEKKILSALNDRLGAKMVEKIRYLA